MKITEEKLDEWANTMSGPVALHLKQILTSVECFDLDKDDCIIYPPTYADIGYCIDEMRDGTKIALIDSVGSQANRMEPFLKSDSKELKDWLVPQIKILIGEKPKNSGGFRESRSLLDIAHRGADAVVQSSNGLAEKLSNAFTALKETGNADPLCVIAPTSLVFGVWDSRGGSNEKRPRLVRSTVRATNVEVLHSATQFNSVWKALSDDQKKELDEAKGKGTKLSEKGFADAPNVFRKTKGVQIPKIEGSQINPEARVLGGILVKGRIVRDITINLVALRGLRGNDDKSTEALRKYLLGLTLITATADIDLFLREGCHLRYLDSDQWREIHRRGDPTEVDLTSDEARKTILDYAENAARPYRERWSDALGEKFEYEFDIKAAKDLLRKKGEEEDAEG